VTLTASELTDIASSALRALDEGRQIAPFTAARPDFALADAYRATAELRRLRAARGERPAGRKIGFTNRTIWDEYGVYAPIWGDMYATTVADIAPGGAVWPLGKLCEPRIEPEIAFGLARAPAPGMDASALLGCIEWVAHGCEIVQSLFPGWVFKPADTVAGFGLHGGYRLGPRVPVGEMPAGDWIAALATFEIELAKDGAVIDRGSGANVLDSPLAALGHLAALLAEDSDNPPLAAGEIVTTGTVTRAFPVAPGETWSTRVIGLPLPGLTIRFV
jgi:2-oxo-3-hexenedioate decarboxylase